MEFIEGLCYTRPHHNQLTAEHPVMRGVWRKCVSLTRPGAIMAPLLVDDRPQPGEICVQSPEELILKTTGRSLQSLPWFGPQISEAELQEKYGALGCVKLDVLYHLHVLWSLALVDPGWKWTVVHPATFQDEQAAMLEELWRWLSTATGLDTMAASLRVSKDEFRAQAREKFFERFTHHWVGEDGRMVAATQPTWKRKRVLHEPLPATLSVAV